MDPSALVGVIGGYVAMALTILGAIYAAVNHKHIRSNCCGKRGEISLDIDTVTPKPSIQVSATAATPLTQYQTPTPPA